MGKYGSFPGGGMGNMQSLMKQAAKLQADLKRKQEEAANTDFEVSVGGGAVIVKATGNKEIKEIKIAKDIVNEQEIEMLQDLIITAVNEAIRKSDAMMKDGLGDFNIPGLM